MVINTASREPDYDAPPYDLRPLVWAAVVRFRGQHTGMFSSECFAAEVARQFDLFREPDAIWCREALRRLDFVVEMPGGKFWKVQTG